MCGESALSLYLIAGHIVCADASPRGDSEEFAIRRVGQCWNLFTGLKSGLLSQRVSADTIHMYFVVLGIGEDGREGGGGNIRIIWDLQSTLYIVNGLQLSSRKALLRLGASTHSLNAWWVYMCMYVCIYVCWPSEGCGWSLGRLMMKGGHGPTK